MTDAQFARRVLIATIVAGGVYLGWELRQALLLVFASVLVAVSLTTLARGIDKRLHFGPVWSLTLALLVVAAVLGLTAYLFGAEVARQFGELAQTLPGAVQSVEAQLREAQLLDEVLAQARQAVPSASDVFGFLSGLASGLLGILSAVGLALIGGVYLAGDPRVYRRGLIDLWPASQRARVTEVADALSRALKSWLSAQLAAMLVIGTLSTIGLWAIGMPSFLALGLIAGIVQFVPLVGPILAAIPALLVALTQGGNMILYTAILYVGIQQLEGNLITPMVQRRVASLPPPLTIFALIFFSLLFGPLGVILAVPLTIVGYTLVGKLWLRDQLGEDIRLPGERDNGVARRDEVGPRASA